MTIKTNGMAKVHRSALPWQALAKFPEKHTEHFQGTIVHGRKLLYLPLLSKFHDILSLRMGRIYSSSPSI